MNSSRVMSSVSVNVIVFPARGRAACRMRHAARCMLHVARCVLYVARCRARARDRVRYHSDPCRTPAVALAVRCACAEPRRAVPGGRPPSRTPPSLPTGARTHPARLALCCGFHHAATAPRAHESGLAWIEGGTGRQHVARAPQPLPCSDACATIGRAQRRAEQARSVCALHACCCVRSIARP